MLRSQRRGRDPPCWLSEKEPLVGKRRVNFQRCWLPVSRIGLHRRGVERVNCGPKLLDLGEKGVYSSYTFFLARLLAVIPVLAPLGFNSREITLASWVRLRGSVPISLAIFPLIFGLPGAPLIFNVVFFVVLLSATIQGSTLPWVARRLVLAEPPPAAPCR